jgi:hypothetical protein
MRVITTSTTVYLFDELSEGAQQKALDNVRERLSSSWDSGDVEDVWETIRLSLAKRFGSPHWEDGAAVPDLAEDGFDLDRGSYVAVSGTLTRDTAPALPWVDTIDSVHLSGRRTDYTAIEVSERDADCTCGADWCEECDPTCARLTERLSDADREAMVDAVRDALAEALTDARAEYEYQTGEERARDHIEANELEFTEDGGIY